jgi:SPP1 family predicted phage head-tail adaptor
VTIQEKISTQDATSGAVVTVWADKWTSIPASVEFLSARDLVAAQSVHSAVKARISIRYRDDISSDMRIIYRGKFYNIEGLLPDKESGLEYITLPVSEGVNNG